MHKFSDYDVYTDGGASPNPGQGAWAFVVIRDGSIIYETFGGQGKTTNNQMEITAALEALRWLKDNTDIVNSNYALYTDSEYVKKGILEWIPVWKSQNWRNRMGKEVANRSLWEQLHREHISIPVSWNWVPGHDNNSGNERAHQLVASAIKSQKQDATPTPPSGDFIYNGPKSGLKMTVAPETWLTDTLNHFARVEAWFEHIQDQTRIPLTDIGVDLIALTFNEQGYFDHHQNTVYLILQMRNIDRLPGALQILTEAGVVNPLLTEVHLAVKTYRATISARVL